MLPTSFMSKGGINVNLLLREKTHFLFLHSITLINFQAHPITTSGRHYHYPHFTYKEREAWRAQYFAQSDMISRVEISLNPRLSDSRTQVVNYLVRLIIKV